VDDTDAEGSSALHYAAAGIQGENNRDVIEYLVANDADWKKLTNTGASLLGLAIFTSNMPVIECWIDTFSNKLDPGIISLTTNALKMAKYRRRALGDKGQAYIIRMLEEFLGTNKPWGHLQCHFFGVLFLLTCLASEAYCIGVSGLSLEQIAPA
jgi:hypothetical protein